MRCVLAVTLWLALSAPPLAAQWSPDRFVSRREQRLAWRVRLSSAEAAQASTASLIRLGVLGGALGVVLGSALIGIPLAHLLAPTD